MVDVTKLSRLGEAFMDAHDRGESDRFIAENLKQAEMLEAALATNDEATIMKVVQEAWDWHLNSPYSAKNYRLAEKADELAKELYGKPFSEMSLDAFDESVCGDDK